MIKALFLSVVWTPALSKKSDDLEHLIQSIKTDFGIIAVPESRLIKNKLPQIGLSILKYSYKLFFVNWDNLLLSSNTNMEISYKIFLEKLVFNWHLCISKKIVKQFYFILPDFSKKILKT